MSSVNRTLLERIREPDPPGQRQLHVSTRAVFESILHNLQSLLNTTQGNSLTDDRYGLPHLTTVRSAMPISLAGYENAIRQTIQKHEPRLTQIRVQHSPGRDGAMALRFEISAIIYDETGQTNVRFETYADDSGRLQVR